MATSHVDVAPATPRVTGTEMLAIGGVAALGVACLLNPEGMEDGPVLCPFRRVTGLPCPGCGLTRSWVYLAHGWWRESFLANPFGMVFVLGVLVLAGLAVTARVRRTARPDLGELSRARPVIVVIAAWILFGLGRLVWTLA